MNRSVDGGRKWTDPVSLTGESQSVFGHSLHRAGERMLLVWHDTRTGRDRLYAATSSDAGVTWTAPARVDHLPESSEVAVSSPTVLLNADGEALVAWQDARNGRDDIFLARSTDGGRTWGSEDQRMDADEPGTALSRFPSLARAKDGRVVLAWDDDRAGLEDVYTRVRSAADSGSGVPRSGCRRPRPSSPLGCRSFSGRRMERSTWRGRCGITPPGRPTSSSGSTPRSCASTTDSRAGGAPPATLRGGRHVVFS